MAARDLNRKPFNEGTIAKLDLFEDYAQEWIPTFVMQGFPVICIIDFFAGPGYDELKTPGTPIRILKKVKEQVSNAREKGVRVLLHLNEFEPGKAQQNKFELLKSSCEEFLQEHPDVADVIKIHYHNEDFESLFPKLLPEIHEYPSLVFLDQNGIKFFTPKYILELEKSPRTDFLYFVASSYFLRFGEKDEFKSHLDVDIEEARKSPYRFIHRIVIDAIRNSLPSNSKLRLYPFTIKKPAGIYGIVFGASHPRAVEKFINRVWKRDEISGEANFDINEDLKKGQRSLFGDVTLTKKEEFARVVEEKILNREILDNFALFDFAITSGHPGNHAARVLRMMRKEGKIDFEGPSPLVTYQAVYGKDRKRLEYKLLGDKHEQN